MSDIDREANIADALSFDYDAYGWGAPQTGELDRMAIDSDFLSDLRMLLIDFHTLDSDFDLRDFLENCSSERYIDLRRAYEVMRTLTAPHPDHPDYYPGREELTRLAIEQSLCPIHFVDWAICFDDKPEDCAQVRAIYPNCHDT